MTKVFYDMMPDHSVSVLLDGEWDLFKSYINLTQYCDSHYHEYQLVDITNTTYQQRIDLGVFDDYSL
ncbi:hypothetical protein Q8W40_05715 [Vibrio penaeicida]|uniref:hypothetical protein n=1 Tax=Vibrio penaeicida TaxID=104609 RepID=UPI00273292DE|nr:hypothetical protein [Vibrio penaeicida]MDP2571668.1 hypothetical protein [Vibrio penaeicida]